jgi:hypothetical protein
MNRLNLAIALFLVSEFLFLIALALQGVGLVEW